ncbi:hypothetical protein H4R34_004693 [Dimargaris verticillata]|uniref:CsbD-like domain-containing protein n=1 Tax=Dimargaris verticillata TaxID=2761393 RepID=A0A9W8E6Y6_9FUNG|nr:hypothetical protein H4R34_004693 [Dimargaris verticillata]
MSTDPSKEHGRFENFTGRVQEEFGKLTGSTKQQSEGVAHQASGATEEAQAKHQGYLEGMADKVSGALKSTYHSLMGDTVQEAKAEGQKAKGEAEMEANK